VSPLRSPALVVLSLAGILAVSGRSEQEPPRAIRFARGSHSAEVQGSVVRGEVRRYSLGARAGQRMQIRLSSIERNAVFQLYRPGGGQAMPGAGEGQDARSWSGALPVNGSYLVVVGSTRGNASYTLRVSIR
jgi:hypothetical protein